MAIKEADKFVNSNIFEGITSVSAIINSNMNGTNDRKIEIIYFDERKTVKKSREYSFLCHRAEELGFEVKKVSADEIEKYTIGNTHGGIIAFCSDRTIKELSESVIPVDGVYFMLEGIEDPYNFGYALRSIYASGADGVILSPRNWMGAAGIVARASAGASELLNIYVSDPEKAVSIFKAKNYKVYCADKPNSVSLYETDLKKPLFMLIGGEKRGNSKVVLENADKIVRIDYGRDFSAALSAASAATVIAFEVMRKNKAGQC